MKLIFSDVMRLNELMQAHAYEQAYPLAVSMGLHETALALKQIISTQQFVLDQLSLFDVLDPNV